MELTERSVELPWLIAHIGTPKRLLDIGSADATYLGILYELCRELYLCDTRPFQPPVPAQKHVGSAHQLPSWWQGFDLVTCVSTLDHIGLDAYGNTVDETLLPAVVAEIERVLAPGGRLLLTVPFGRPQVTRHPRGGQRVFDEEGLLGPFAAERWTCLSSQVWRCAGSTYAPATVEAVVDAGYLTWRAEAVIAVELSRLP